MSYNLKYFKRKLLSDVDKKGDKKINSKSGDPHNNAQSSQIAELKSSIASLREDFRKRYILAQTEPGFEQCRTCALVIYLSGDVVDITTGYCLIANADYHIQFTTSIC